MREEGGTEDSEILSKASGNSRRNSLARMSPRRLEGSKAHAPPRHCPRFFPARNKVCWSRLCEDLVVHFSKTLPSSSEQEVTNVTSRSVHCVCIDVLYQVRSSLLPTRACGSQVVGRTPPEQDTRPASARGVSYSGLDFLLAAYVPKNSWHFFETSWTDDQPEDVPLSCRSLNGVRRISTHS